MNKSVNFKLPPAAKTAEEWVGQGIEPHIKQIVAVAQAAQPEAVVMKRFTIDVSADLHRRIKMACVDRGQVMADVIREMLEEKFPA